jgi:hypothetical protein
MVWSSAHWQGKNQIRLDKKEADNLIKNITKGGRTKQILTLCDSSQAVNCINRSSVGERECYVITAGKSVYVLRA